MKQFSDQTGVTVKNTKGYGVLENKDLEGTVNPLVLERGPSGIVTQVLHH